MTTSHSVSRRSERLLMFADPTRSCVSSTMVILAWQ